MFDYAEKVMELREAAEKSMCGECGLNLAKGSTKKGILFSEAADAIEELLRIGAKMHTWIFLHTTDEQAAYDEIGLTDEQNAMFGYSGQMILKAEPPKEVE